MAEQVKRRVAAARLAVAFVAAGTIAGASAWATASPPPPTAESSAKGEHIKKAVLTVRSSAQVVDGSLLYQDFKKGEVPSFEAFKRFEKVIFHNYKKATNSSLSSIKGEIGDIKSQIDGIKGESSNYLKVTDDVVRGDGSVFTATGAVGAQQVRMADVPAMFTVDAQGPIVTITNTSGSPLGHTSCQKGAAGQPEPAGEIAPGATLSCDISGGDAQTLQVVGHGGGGGAGKVATLNFSQLPAVQGGDPQITVQILVGL